MTSVHVRAVAIAAAALLASSGVLTASLPAEAVPSTITVTSTADTDATGACAGGTTLADPVTLRNALCVANNRGGHSDIQVADGTYRLVSTLGSLVVGTATGTSIAVSAAPGAAPKVVGDGQHQVFTIDPGPSNGAGPVGGIDVTIDGLTVSGGVDNVYGGGAIIGGSGSATTADTLTIRNSTFSGNTANTTTGATANPGGAIQFIGGALTVADSTFTGNDSGGSAGGAIAYQAQGAAGGESLSITGSTFSGNGATATAASGNGGGAIAVSDLSGSATMTVTGSTFSGNTGTATSGPFRGAAVLLDGGSLTVTGSTFTANTAPAGSAFAVKGGTLTAHLNRIVGNTAPALAVTGGAAAATQNWWGCATGPGGSGCDSATGVTTQAVAPYLTLGVTASPATIVAPATTSTLTASLLKDSSGAAVDPAGLTAFAGLPVAWSGAQPTGSGLSPTQSPLAAGTATTTFTAGSAGGTGGATATLDDATVSAAVSVYAPPAFTSPATIGAVVGTASSFTVRSTGYPAPSLALSGVLPTGLSFVDNGDGTATVSGTPGAGTGGDYPLTVKAVNVAAPSGVTQSLTVSVQQAPAFSSTGGATFQTGTSGTFTVTATGRPAPDPITLTGTLPSGVAFTDNHNGTATIAGTPSAAAGGVYSVTLQAANGVGTAATQSFTLTVDAAPSITSAATMTTTLGVPSSFTVTTADAYPANPALSIGAVSAGLVFTDNGDGTATISGTPTGAGGSTNTTITASNGVLPNATQAFSIVVLEAPFITLAAADQTVNVGATASFTAGASGFPAPTVQWQVSSDGGSSFTPIQGATSTTLSPTTGTSSGRSSPAVRAMCTRMRGSPSATRPPSPARPRPPSLRQAGRAPSP